MSTPGVFTPYSTIAPFFGVLPSWVDPLEQHRIASYLKYEEIFWSGEEGFVQVMRGDNENAIFLPTARILVNTVNRYTGCRLSHRISGADVNSVTLAQLAFDSLFKREGFFSQYYSGKRYWLIRGDWVWHLVANPAKALGSRLSIENVDPGAYFPVYDEDDPRRIIKVHLAETITVDNVEKVSRMTYEKGEDGLIYRSHGVFEMEEWWNLDTPEQVILPREALPGEITAIPVYHLKHFDPNAPFGSSLLRGLESVLLGVNQIISDENLTLSMEGLGNYATDGSLPRDANGNETDVIMGPGRILGNAAGLRRLDGVGSVVPYGDHYGRLRAELQEAVGATDAATGRVTPDEAESGVALLLRLAPTLADAEERDQHILDVLGQMFYDLVAWLSVYEELPLLADGLPVVEVLPVLGEKLPPNLKQLISNIAELRSLVPPIISIRTSHQLLREAGLKLDDRELELLTSEASGNFDPLAEPTGEEEEALNGRVRSEL